MSLSQMYLCASSTLQIVFWNAIRRFSGHAAAGYLLDPEGELLVWRREGEEYVSEEEGEEEGEHGPTINVQQLGILTRLHEARLGCSLEEAALQVHFPQALTIFELPAVHSSR